MIFSKFFTSKIKRTGRTEEIWYFCQCLKCSTKRVQNWTWVYLVTYSTQRGHTTSPSRIFPIWWKKIFFWGFPSSLHKHSSSACLAISRFLNITTVCPSMWPLAIHPGSTPLEKKLPRKLKALIFANVFLCDKRIKKRSKDTEKSICILDFFKSRRKKYKN